MKQTILNDEKAQKGSIIHALFLTKYYYTFLLMLVVGMMTIYMQLVSDGQAVGSREYSGYFSSSFTGYFIGRYNITICQSLQSP
jgi:hypothetical protein